VCACVLRWVASARFHSSPVAWWDRPSVRPSVRARARPGRSTGCTGSRATYLRRRSPTMVLHNSNNNKNVMRVRFIFYSDFFHFVLSLLSQTNIIITAESWHPSRIERLMYSHGWTTVRYYFFSPPQILMLLTCCIILGILSLRGLQTFTGLVGK